MGISVEAAAWLGCGVLAGVAGLLHDLLTPIQSLTNYRDMTPFVIATAGLLVLSRHRRIMTQSREEA